MKKVLLLIALGLAACSPRDAEPGRIQTDTLQPPTAAPTLVPMSQLDLEPLLVQSGDLPPGVVGSQIRARPPDIIPGIPVAAAQIYQAFDRSDSGTVFELSGVYVFLYDDPAQAEAAFNVIVDAMMHGGVQGSVGGLEGLQFHSPPIGQRSVSALSPFWTLESVTDIAWLNCRAVVYTRMPADVDAISAYAERLNSRLEPLVCDG